MARTFDPVQLGSIDQIAEAFAKAEIEIRGELAETVEPLGGRPRPFHILYLQNRHLSARVREIPGAGKRRRRQAATAASGSSHGRS
jgi:hypothetical protein